MRHHEKKSVPEYMTRNGAEWAAQKIRDHWAKRSPHVKVWIEACPGKPQTNGSDPETVYCVRTNLLNGLPRKEAA